MNKLLLQITNIRKYKFLIYQLVSKDIKLKYRRSVLGYLWSLLNPLLMMIVVSTVFSFIFKAEVNNFPLYLLIGQIMFQFFSESTTMAMGAIIQNAALIKKAYIPKYVFPVSRVFSCSVNLIFSLVALLIVMFFTKESISWTFLLIPIPIIFILIFSLGVSMILSVYAVYFRDLLHLYGILTTLWMYLTPIFYPIAALPQSIKWLIEVNPLTQFITFFRTIVLEGKLPTVGNTTMCIMWCLASLLIGITIFRKKQANFVLYI